MQIFVSMLSLLLLLVFFSSLRHNGWKLFVFLFWLDLPYITFNNKCNNCWVWKFFPHCVGMESKAKCCTNNNHKTNIDEPYKGGECMRNEYRGESTVPNTEPLYVLC